MAYRATERTEAKRAATRARIVDAAHGLIAHGGYREAGVANVAARAGVATGTVYRHFPSKVDLFAEVFRRASQREVDAVTDAAAAADPHATARLAAAVETFIRRALAGRRLAWALLAEPVDPVVEAERLVFRHAYAQRFGSVLREGIAAGELPAQDTDLSAAALVGALGEALVGPLSPLSAGGTPFVPSDPSEADALVSGLVTFSLRAVSQEVELPHAARH
jgi:AcrR family transcriptional regulator